MYLYDQGKSPGRKVVKLLNSLRLRANLCPNGSDRCEKYCWLILGAGIVSAIGCGSAVVVYTAQDEEFAQPVFAQFERATHVKPAAKFDVESTKTVGLVNEIIAEAQQPRCDVFWNNEILNTLRLEKLGLLEAVSLAGGRGVRCPVEIAKRHLDRFRRAGENSDCEQEPCRWRRDGRNRLKI